MKKICFIATIPAVVHAFLRNHINIDSEKYLVTVICNFQDNYLLNGIKANIILMPIERKPSLLKDFITLLALCRVLNSERFDIVHTHMPKTGLLGMLAAFLIGIPIRIHTFHGEVWATRSGWRRKLLKLFDKFVAFLATDILLVSPSQRDFLFREGVLSLNQGKVIGSGSVCGVDHLRFHPDKNIRIDFRTSLGIKNCSTVILFLGRLNKDKGLLDLARAFHSISQSHTDAVLLIVGTEEDLPFIRIQEICSTTCDRLFYLPFTSKPECYMAAADIFCLPSYREGFGMTIIEAASCGIPTVGSRIYGITDAVADGKTGLLFPAGDVLALTNTLLILIDDNELRRQMGNDARVRAIELFSSDRITGEMLLLYDNLLKDADAQ